MTTTHLSRPFRTRPLPRLVAVGAAGLLAVGGLAACGSQASAPDHSSDHAGHDQSAQPTPSAPADLQKLLLDEKSAPAGATVADAPQLPPGAAGAFKDIVRTMTIEPQECAPLKATMERAFANDDALAHARFVRVGSEQTVVQLRPGADYEKATAPSACTEYRGSLEVAGQKVKISGKLTPVDMQLDGAEKSAGYELTSDVSGAPGQPTGPQQLRGVVALVRGVTVAVNGSSAEQVKSVAQAQIDKIKKAG